MAEKRHLSGVTRRKFLEGLGAAGAVMIMGQAIRPMPSRCLGPDPQIGPASAVTCRTPALTLVRERWAKTTWIG